MDKDSKKIKYQEMFLSELRNNHFGEKKLEKSILEMETKENMKKLAKALKSIWKQTDENVKDLEKTFPVSEHKEASTLMPFEKQQAQIKEVEDKSKGVHLEAGKAKKNVASTTKLPSYQILTYDNLVELVDDLNIEQITQILESASSSDGDNHQYLIKVAEKLVKERDSRA